VGALLELGAGFHPDLSGRENVYLNGSILGFSRAQMNCVFDEIVDFSEMGRFIDVPVKHYSSGMYMRLGFSIAIHLHPDILLVDEVLAVGDQTFQFRCLDQINKMKRDGVAIVLVSHNLESVREMCEQVIWLDEGQIRAQGPAEQVLEAYMTQVFVDAERTLLAEESTRRQAEAVACDAGGLESRGAGARAGSPQRWGSREGEIVRVEILDDQGQERRVFKTGDTLIVRMHFLAKQPIEHPQFGLALYHASGFHINGPNTVFAGLDIGVIEGEGTIEHVIERLPLLEGTYLLSVSLYDESGTHAYDHHHQAYTFRVRPNEAIGERYGSVLIPSVWRLGPVDRESGV
jgi:lipopolysaccharide transport system ATP-binding protein